MMGEQPVKTSKTALTVWCDTSEFAFTPAFIQKSTRFSLLKFSSSGKVCGTTPQPAFYKQSEKCAGSELSRGSANPPSLIFPVHLPYPSKSRPSGIFSVTLPDPLQPVQRFCPIHIIWPTHSLLKQYPQFLKLLQKILGFILAL